MADVTAQFTVYKGVSPKELKHVATVLKQSNLKNALQLIKQQPYNKNIFVNPREKKSIIEFSCAIRTTQHLRVSSNCTFILYFKFNSDKR